MTATARTGWLHADRDTGLAPQAVSVLVVSPLQADYEYLEHLFAQSHWKFARAASVRDALRFLSRTPVAVVLCETDLPDGTWNELLKQVNALADPPVLVVTTRAADDCLWAEVLNLGAYDVLMKPFDGMEVVRVVTMAWRCAKDNRVRACRARATLRVAAAGTR